MIDPFEFIEDNMIKEDPILHAHISYCLDNKKRFITQGKHRDINFLNGISHTTTILALFNVIPSSHTFEEDNIKFIANEFCDYLDEYHKGHDTKGKEIRVYEIYSSPLSITNKIYVVYYIATPKEEERVVYHQGRIY